MALIVTQAIASISQESGGPAYSVPYLSEALRKLGTSVKLRTLGTSDKNERPALIIVHPATGRFFGPLLQTSPPLRDALLADLQNGAIIHCHGLWLMPNIYPAWAKRRAKGNGKLVHSPRGMLAPAALRISAWKKRPFWWLFQRAALAAADCLHATAASEYQEIRNVGLTNPVAIIPNGIDLPDLANAPRATTAIRTALSLGRIHPKKGLDRLIRAWAAVESAYPDWNLRIIGPVEGKHDEELRALTFALGTQRVSIEPPIYGNDRLATYRSSDLFVLPTLNENFAMTVAEALAAEVPVISTRGAPWAGLERERCGWWIDHGVEPLADALRVAMDLPRSELHKMGARGRVWMARDFGWDRIASDMIEVYLWLKDGGPTPSTVQIK